jgi:hypothetical protein
MAIKHWSDYLDLGSVTTGVNIYTGRWFNASALPANKRRKEHSERLPDMFHNQSLHVVDEIKHHSMVRLKTSELLYTRAAEMASFPLLSVVPYEDAAKDYVFYPSVITKREGKGDAANTIKISQSIKTVESRQLAVNKDKVHVYAYGASHMRYHFDSLLRYYYPSDEILYFNRKHEDLKINNLRFFYKPTIQYMVDEIDYMCRITQNGTDVVLVVHGTSPTLR